MNKAKRSILIGLIIGDGYIKLNPHKKTAEMQFKHSAAQRPLLEHKVNLLTSALGGKKVVIREFNNNGFPGVAASKSDKYFRIIRRWLYRDGRKNRLKALSLIDEHGLALWYMDDGCLAKKRKKGSDKVSAVDLYLCCHEPLEVANKMCRHIAERFGVEFKPNFNNGAYRLRCATREARKFVQIVRPYIIPEMSYKIDVHGA